jgi:peptidoglycan/LPS O-acetylase OafA/YrhL
MSSETRSTVGGRIQSLDGLRGVAALVVLVHHSALLFPALAATYFDRSTTSGSSLVWWLTYTPAHLLWEGDGAVYVFFILSGVVLTLPFVNRPFHAMTFYPQRLLRLYVPIWAAVIFAAVTVYLVPRTGNTPNDWLNTRVEGVTAGVIARDLTLVRGPGGLATPLWSLQWEILFSLALPVYLWIAFKVRRMLIVKFALLLAVIAASPFVEGTLHYALAYMPMFMLGVVMVTERHTLARWSVKCSERRGSWPALFALGLVLLASRWYVIAATPSRTLQDSSICLAVCGAGTVIFCAMYWPPLKSALEARPAQWLGTVSFSLYLIHEPILVTLGYLLGAELATWAAISGFALSLLLAQLFFRLIERPSHRLAKAVGAKFRSERHGDTKLAATSA